MQLGFVASKTSTPGRLDKVPWSNVQPTIVDTETLPTAVTAPVGILAQRALWFLPSLAVPNLFALVPSSGRGAGPPPLLDSP